MAVEDGGGGKGVSNDQDVDGADERHEWEMHRGTERHDRPLMTRGDFGEWNSSAGRNGRRPTWFVDFGYIRSHHSACRCHGTAE